MKSEQLFRLEQLRTLKLFENKITYMAKKPATKAAATTEGTFRATALLSSSDGEGASAPSAEGSSAASSDGESEGESEDSLAGAGGESLEGEELGVLPESESGSGASASSLSSSAGAGEAEDEPFGDDAGDVPFAGD